MPISKLPRATLEQKIQILDYHHRSARPQLETVDRYKNEISISTSSFSEWLKNEDELRERFRQAESSFLKHSRRKVKFKYEKINNAMDLLVKQKLERNEPINEPMLREHWSIYAHQFGVDDPKRLVGFSHGWLSQFKKRHGLNKSNMSGTSPTSVAPKENQQNQVLGNKSPVNSPPTDSHNQSNQPQVIGGSVQYSIDNRNLSSLGILQPIQGQNGYQSFNDNSSKRSSNSTTEGNTFETEPSTDNSATDDFNNSSNTSNSSNTYDLMNQNTSKRAAIGPNELTMGNQFRPEQSLNFSSPTPTISNLVMYQQMQHQQRQQQDQQPQRHQQHHQQHHNQPHHSLKNRQHHQQEADHLQQQLSAQKNSFAKEPTFEYQQLLRVRYEKQKHQYERQRLSRSNVVMQPNADNHDMNVLAPISIPDTIGLRASPRRTPVPGSPRNGAERVISPREERTREDNTLGDDVLAISATDIERFIYIFADRFFRDHQYEFPQTMKVFEEFKNSFFNEMVINMRSKTNQQPLSVESILQARQPSRTQDHEQKNLLQAHLHHQRLAQPPLHQHHSRQFHGQHPRAGQLPQLQHHVSTNLPQPPLSTIDDFFMRSGVVGPDQSRNELSPASMNTSILQITNHLRSNDIITRRAMGENGDGHFSQLQPNKRYKSDG